MHLQITMQLELNTKHQTQPELGKQRKKLENTLNNIKEWMDSMRLKLNCDKTEYIQFGSRQQIKKIDTLIHDGQAPEYL